jgi:CHAT domain-containing protein
VPRLLPTLLARAPNPDRGEALLLVGDVDYGGSPGREHSARLSRSAAGVVTGSLPEFGLLPASRPEILAIRDSFRTQHERGKVRILGRDKATEEAFKIEASKCRWLHVATHGFFAPKALRSALAPAAKSVADGTSLTVAGYHPGVLSGLALSGANTPPVGEGDDGILTALEVASLDLSNVEVAVLSACETGLGEVAGGEGVLGLQRAFQVAGVRTTVTSMWKVPDAATQLLMQRFYENLWEKGLGKLEALREAQLWVRREGRSRVTGSGESRGVRIPDQDEPSSGESRNLPPFYWAGFVLSGDWR